MARPILLIALIVVGWLLYKLYFKQFLQQGKPGKIKLGLVALGLILLALALTGRAPALLAILGAAMTQIMRIAPLLIRFAPSLRRYLGTGALGGMAGAASAGGRGGDAGVSRVTTRTIDMTLEHATGRIDGHVKSGEFAGRQLSELSIQELSSVYAHCKQTDPDALRLLSAYASKERAAEWQEQHGDHDPGDQSSTGSSGSSAMGLDEARQILGVAADASEAEIIAAHRSLMGRLHPDKGGNNYLAAKVNAAKAVLLDSKNG